MPDELRLSFTRDEDAEGFLCVEVQANGFAGRSSIWIAARELSAFARELLQTYPLSADRPIALAGGYGIREHEAQADRSGRTHVSLQVYPLGARGDVGIGVLLATPLHEGDRPESQRRVVVELSTHYEPLGRFAREIMEMAEGREDEAVLGGSAGSP